jgi:hypothetical protein
MAVNEDDLAQVAGAVAERRDNGKKYVKASNLDQLDYSKKYKGKLLAQLEREGLLRLHSNGNSKTWEIL